MASLVSLPYQFVGQLGYYTHSQEPGLGLMQLGVRFYDPEVGRFTQRDPVRSGGNWYSYGYEAPTVAVDPTGKIAWVPILVGAGIVYGAFEICCLRKAWVAANEANNAGNDKLAHCLLGCRIKRCLGLLAEAHIMRLLFVLWEQMGGVNDPDDVEAGMVGLDCSWRCAGGRYDGKCGKCCLDQLRIRGIN
jgi:RHS repeat-associated protein